MPLSQACSKAVDLLARKGNDTLTVKVNIINDHPNPVREFSPFKTILFFR